MRLLATIVMSAVMAVIGGCRRLPGRRAATRRR